MAVPQGWVDVDDALEQTFELPSFAEAIAFVNRVAELAETENHHPDIAVSTRRSRCAGRPTRGGITERDRELAVRSAALR